MVSLAIIGIGRWGPNLLRNFISMEDVSVEMLCDADNNRLMAVKKRFPEIERTTNPQDIMEKSTIDCVVISTPLSTHFSLACKALEAGHHVLVEKPLTSSSSACQRLITTAEKMNKILFVGHTFKYNAGIRAVKEYIDSGELGEIYLINANRTNLGPVRYDTNALWDLASHDISIFSYWMGENPIAVSGHGGCYLNKEIEDVVYATLKYKSGVIAHVHASWLNPRKIREITVVGEKKMLVWNDMHLSEPIRIYNRGFERDDDYQDTFGDFRLSIREGEVIIPNVQLNEPLLAECEHFIECVKTGTQPLTDGYDGLHVVRVLEAASESMRSQSILVALH
jgi:predicted dehydrogenase